MSRLSNIDIKKDEDKTIIRINPKIYPLDVVYSATYVFLDKAYILIDGNPKKEILVELKPKDKKNISIGEEFNNELLNYANHKMFFEKNKDIRNAIIQRALITNDPSVLESKDKKEILKKAGQNLLDSLEKYENIEDEESISLSWEKKYAKDLIKKRKNGKRKAK